MAETVIVKLDLKEFGSSDHFLDLDAIGLSWPLPQYCFHNIEGEGVIFLEDLEELEDREAAYLDHCAIRLKKTRESQLPQGGELEGVKMLRGVHYVIDE